MGSEMCIRDRAKTAWTEIESRAKTARTVGLLTPTDVAQVSWRPDGVGKKVIAFAGLIGGLMIGIGLVFILAPPMPQPTSSPTAAVGMPRQQIPTPTGVFTAAGNSVSNASFQQAASAMQSAANAMQLAATSETAAHQAAPPSQPAPTVSRTPQGDPAAQPQAMAPQTVSSQPVNQTQPQQPQAQPASQPGAASQPVAQAVPATNPANVRPVDLAKSASENNEFVRVSGGAAIAPQPETEAPQRAKLDSKVSKSARAIADSVSNSAASDPQRTIMLSTDEKVKTVAKGEFRNPVPTDPFIVTADGQTSQSTTNDSGQDANDVIPEQIRKLSESIMKFGKDKK